VDLMAAQIKTLSFLAYIVRMYQEMVAQHSNLMVKGLLGMLTICPMEVTHLRKELLIASRHILATDLRVSEYCHKTCFKSYESSHMSLCSLCFKAHAVPQGCLSVLLWD
jgi:hypothetical protein